MNQGGTKATDLDVTVGKNRLNHRLHLAFAVTLLPIAAAFIALLIVRQPALEIQISSQLATDAAQDRAGLLVRFNNEIFRRIERLGQMDPVLRTAAGPASLPEALSITAIPLDDLGTVKLSPGDFALGGHIEIDLIRRAFQGEFPPPEAITRDGLWRLTYVRAYQTEAEQGVLLVELPINVLAPILGDTKGTRFALQQQNRRSVVTLFGTKDDRGDDTTSAQVGNTQWLVQAQTKSAWVDRLITGNIWVLGAATSSIVGVLLGGLILLRGIPSILRTEAERIVDSADNKFALEIHVAELLPVARLLRQRALLNRRQLITSPRKTIDAPGSSAEKVTSNPPDEFTSEALAAELDEPEALDDGIPTHIFTPDGVSGRMADELTMQLTERICRALAVMAIKKQSQTLIVCCDGKPTSEKLRATVVKTLLASGRDVVDLGRAPAPLMYFATHETEYDSGVLIRSETEAPGSASLRIVLQGNMLGSQGAEELLETIRDGEMDHGSGRTIKLDMADHYLDRLALDVGTSAPLQVVLDGNFGAAAELANDALNLLGCEVISYNNAKGGTPVTGQNIHSALEALGSEVTKQGADLGLLFDGDSDRLHVVTNEGQAVAADQLLMLLARDLLERNPGADVVYDIQCSRHFSPFITRSGGRAVISQSGLAHIYAKMMQTQALLGGDFSGHIFFKDRWFGFEDGVYAAARLVELLVTSGDSLHDALKSLPSSVSTRTLSVSMTAADAKQLMKTLTTQVEFPGARVTTLDGLRLDYSDSWALVQKAASGTGLTVRFEGNDEEAMSRAQSVLRTSIRDAMPSLELPF